MIQTLIVGVIPHCFIWTDVGCDWLTGDAFYTRTPDPTSAFCRGLRVCLLVTISVYCLSDLLPVHVLFIAFHQQIQTHIVRLIF